MASAQARRDQCRLLDRALDASWLAFQPVVAARGGALFGYEALLRSHEPALARPDVIFQVATHLERLREVGRKVRGAAAAALAQAPAGSALLVNLHPSDLDDPQLYDRSTDFSRAAPRIILEITEQAALAPLVGVRARIQELRERGFRIALDDLGAAHSGLTNLVAIEPDIVKLDRGLVRDVQASRVKQCVVSTICAMGKAMQALVVAEGIETTAERDILIDLGCDLLQGFLFARPAAGFAAPAWP